MVPGGRYREDVTGMTGGVGSGGTGMTHFCKESGGPG